MERSEEKSRLMSDLFDAKAKLPFARNDEKTREELLRKISEIRDQLVQLELEEMMEKEREEIQEGRKMKNG